jgi:hypothetical protein
MLDAQKDANDRSEILFLDRGTQSTLHAQLVKRTLFSESNFVVDLSIESLGKIKETKGYGNMPIRT